MKPFFYWGISRTLYLIWSPSIHKYKSVENNHAVISSAQVLINSTIYNEYKLTGSGGFHIRLTVTSCEICTSLLWSDSISQSCCCRAFKVFKTKCSENTLRTNVRPIAWSFIYGRHTACWQTHQISIGWKSTGLHRKYFSLFFSDASIPMTSPVYIDVYFKPCLFISVRSDVLTTSKLNQDANLQNIFCTRNKTGSFVYF